MESFSQPDVTQGRRDPTNPKLEKRQSLQGLQTLNFTSGMFSKGERFSGFQQLEPYIDEGSKFTRSL